MTSYQRTLIALLGCLLGLELGSASLAAEPALPKGKILFVGKKPDHPFGTHMYLHTSQMLAKCVALNNDIECTISEGWPEDAATLTGAAPSWFIPVRPPSSCWIRNTATR